MNTETKAGGQLLPFPFPPELPTGIARMVRREFPSFTPRLERILHFIPSDPLGLLWKYARGKYHIPFPNFVSACEHDSKRWVYCREKFQEQPYNRIPAIEHIRTGFSTAPWNIALAFLYCNSVGRGKKLNSIEAFLKYEGIDPRRVAQMIKKHLDWNSKRSRRRRAAAAA